MQLQLKQPEKECLQVAMETKQLCGGGARQRVTGRRAPQAEPYKEVKQNQTKDNKLLLRSI